MLQEVMFFHLFSFRTAFLLSKYKPRCPIIAITRDHRTARKVCSACVRARVHACACVYNLLHVHFLLRSVTCTEGFIPTSIQSPSVQRDGQMTWRTDLRRELSLVAARTSSIPVVPLCC